MAICTARSGLWWVRRPRYGFGWTLKNLTISSPAPGGNGEQGAEAELHGQDLLGRSTGFSPHCHRSLRPTRRPQPSGGRIERRLSPLSADHGPP
jgi:hypothetical protein